MKKMTHHTIQLWVIREASMTTAETKQQHNSLQPINLNTSQSNKNSIETKFQLTNHGQEQREPRTWCSEQTSKEAKQPNC